MFYEFQNYDSKILGVSIILSKLCMWLVGWFGFMVYQPLLVI